MKLNSEGPFSYVLEITPQDCAEHSLNFEKIKEYYIYKQNKRLYDKVPSYMFEPPAPPKKAGFFKKLFKKKEVPVKTKPQSSFSMEMDVYFQKKLDDIRAKGLPLYTNAELHTLWGFENELVMFVQSFGMAESEKEQPLFETEALSPIIMKLQKMILLFFMYGPQCLLYKITMARFLFSAAASCKVSIKASP